MTNSATLVGLTKHDRRITVYSLAPISFDSGFMHVFEPQLVNLFDIAFHIRQITDYHFFSPFKPSFFIQVPSLSTMVILFSFQLRRVTVSLLVCRHSSNIFNCENCHFGKRQALWVIHHFGWGTPSVDFILFFNVFGLSFMYSSLACPLAFIATNHENIIE
uniref:Uncharacterized protein n=1 Tax=Solanum tuberosum TaxID=4113 RepID=M1BZE4_SOLTU